MRNDLKRFDGFVPIEPEIYEDPDGDVIFTDATTDCLRNPVDISIYTPGLPEGSKAQMTDQLSRIKKLSHKEFRKKTGAFSVNPYHLEVAFSDRKTIADAFLQEINKKLQYYEIGGFETTPHNKQ